MGCAPLEPGRVRALGRELAGRFAGTAFSLTPIPVSCACPVFRADSPDRPPMFVKLAAPDAAVRTLRFLRAAGAAGCPLLPRILLDEPFAFDGRSVVCLEWKSCHRVEIEDMSEDEADSLLSGMVGFSKALVSAPDVLPADGEDAFDAEYDVVAGYARRHPLVSRFMSSLTGLPEAERAYGNRRLTAIHGDLHACNFGFADGRLAAVFDFDAIRMGLPCEDVAYAFTESIRRHGLPSAKRAHVHCLFRRVVRTSPWPADEWRIAVNHARLRIAANRIRKHPKSPLTAFDVAHRDREVRPLLEDLK